MSERPRVVVSYEQADDIAKDLEKNLLKGRAFALGASGLAQRDACEVVLRAPDGSELSLLAEAVWIQAEGPGAGVGVQFQPFGDAEKSRLKDFAEQATNSEAPSPTPTEQAGGSSAPPAGSSEGSQRPSRRPTGRPSSLPPAARNIHERVRGLSIRDRQRMARDGNLTERVALERCYSSSVWEYLLQNQSLSASEAARIAKKGNLPHPLMKIILSNAGWLKAGEVQRALLANPRLNGPDIERVLRNLSRADLNRLPQQSGYRPGVRQAAKRLLGKPS